MNNIARATNFYLDKNILITGHTGFIGSWLTKVLLMNGAKILGYSLDPPTEPNLYNVLDIGEKIVDVRGDIRDRQKISRIVSEFEPEIVFHFAAQPIVLDSYNDPTETFETNIMGTVNLLKSVQRVGATKTIIVMTSDKVYKNNDKSDPFRETDPLGGKDPYSSSKSCQDIIVSSFRESYFLDSGVGISSIRAGNIIGGGDWGNRRIVPDLVKGITENKVIRIRNPDSIRPWQYVLDVVFGLLELTDKMKKPRVYSGEWNFGPGAGLNPTVKELSDLLINYWGNGKYIIERDKAGLESTRLELDTSKVKFFLNYHPILPIKESIKETVQWYKEFYLNRENIKQFTEKIIKEYAARALLQPKVGNYEIE